MMGMRIDPPHGNWDRAECLLHSAKPHTLLRGEYVLPNRIIRAGINDSDRVDALSEGAEIFYRRLMNVVDDFGRFEADHRKLRSQCWPKKFDKIAPSLVIEWLDECSSGEDPLIVIYHSGGKRFLEIQNFNQRTKTGQKSKFPENPGQSGKIPDDPSSRARTPPTPKETPPTSVDPFFEPWCEGIYAAHPKKKNKFFAMHELMKFRGKPAEQKQLSTNHALWCATKGWTDNNGQFAPPLDDWIRDDGWKHPPIGKNGRPDDSGPLPVDNRPLSEKFAR